MTLTLQNVPDTQGFLGALKNFLSQYMKAHPNEFKAYHDVDEMFEDILAAD